MLPGFVTIGRTELLLSIFTIALLMVLLGFVLGYLTLTLRRPEPIKLRPMTPEQQKTMNAIMRKACHGPHCDDGPELAAWLKRKDFQLITSEVLSGMRAEIASGRVDARIRDHRAHNDDRG